MKLYQIVLKDILRRKRRVLYAALGVLIGTMTVVGVLTIAYAGQNKIYGQLEKYGANLSIVPAVNNIDTSLGNLNLGTISVGDNYIKQSYLPEIQDIADTRIRQALKNVVQDGPIATVAPKLYINADVRGASVIVMGVDPIPEFAVRSWWQTKQGAFLQGGNDAMVGATAAEILKLQPGDAITLKDTTFNVVGILDATGSSEDYQVIVPIAALQTAFGKEGMVSAIDLRALCNGCPVEVIADAINGAVPGVKAVAVKQIASTEMDMVGKVNRLMLSLAGITLIIGIFGVVNTMMTSVHERTRDIGIMRAVGASRRQIVTVFMIEALVIGVIGGILGYLAGTALAYGIGPVIFSDVAITFLPQFIPVALGLAIAVAVIATVAPAISATRIKIAEAFRSL